MQQVKVFCVNVGTKYSVDYVYKLKNMVNRHLNLPHKFYCITDTPEKYEYGIQCDENLDTWWNKISIFKYTGRCLYFDLDTIIHNTIDDLVKDEFTIVNPIWKNIEEAVFIEDRPDIDFSRCNSSVMSWKNEIRIYEKFMSNAEYYMLKYGGDDRFIDHECAYKTYTNNLIYSYRDGVHWKDDSATFKYRKELSVALFHQKPEITDMLDHDIVIDNWH